VLFCSLKFQLGSIIFFQCLCYLNLKHYATLASATPLGALAPTNLAPRFHEAAKLLIKAFAFYISPLYICTYIYVCMYVCVYSRTPLHLGGVPQVMQLKKKYRIFPAHFTGFFRIFFNPALRFFFRPFLLLFANGEHCFCILIDFAMCVCVWVSLSVCKCANFMI